MKTYRRSQLATLLFVAAAALPPILQAEPETAGDFKAKSGKITFNVDSNIAFLKVAGQSSSIRGGGEAELEGESVLVRNIKFEVDPKTLKTGMSLRDQHMYEKVFTAADGSIPPVVLRADRFEARPNGQPAKWEGNLEAQLTIRGVTRPVSFTATIEKNGGGAVISARGKVKTSAFGVKPITYSGAAVEEEVAITVTDLRVAP